jgi:hypothetical protein
MMMSRITSHTTQSKLNMERLKAVRERLQQNNAPPASNALPVFSSNLQQTQQVEASKTGVGSPNRVETSLESTPFANTTSSTVPSAPALLSSALREQDYSRFQDQVQSQVQPPVQSSIDLKDDPSPIQAPRTRTLLPPPPLTQGRFGLPVGDIQSVAEKAGFVGVDQSAIERAYATRKSLFVDLKI